MRYTEGLLGMENIITIVNVFLQSLTRNMYNYEWHIYISGSGGNMTRGLHTHSLTHQAQTHNKYIANKILLISILNENVRRPGY